MIRIGKKTVTAIIAQARKELPNEACGYLAAQDDRIARHYPMTNTDAAGDHFSMDPAEQFAAVKDMRERGLKLRAVYHSHPETPARPSAEDIRLAYDPNVSYVIISLADTEPTIDIKSFIIKDEQVSPEELKIEEEHK